MHVISLGYALAAALAKVSFADDKSLKRVIAQSTWLENENNSVDKLVDFTHRKDAILSCLVTKEDISRMCTAMIDSGARDGVTGESSMMVDGMPLSVSLSIFDDIISIAQAE